MIVFTNYPSNHIEESVSAGGKSCQLVQGKPTLHQNEEDCQHICTLGGGWSGLDSASHSLIAFYQCVWWRACRRHPPSPRGNWSAADRKDRAVKLAIPCRTFTITDAGVEPLLHHHEVIIPPCGWTVHTPSLRQTAAQPQTTTTKAKIKKSFFSKAVRLKNSSPLLWVTE